MGLMRKKLTRFNRRMRKTARPVVWKAGGPKCPLAHPILKRYAAGAWADVPLNQNRLHGEEGGFSD